MPRLATLLAALLLVLPASAFAQGAGDDQYQDPFGDEPSQSDSDSGSGSGSGSSGDDGGLSTSPPVTGGGSSTGSGSGSGSGTTTTTPSTATQATEAGGQLPRTGSDPRILVLVGASMVLTGVGLRLRTIDPDAF